MKLGRKGVFAAMLALAVVFLIILWVLPKGPQAGGHSLNYWLDQPLNRSVQFHPEAAAALKEIGYQKLFEAASNAPPPLIRRGAILARQYLGYPLLNSGMRQITAAIAVVDLFPERREQTYLTLVAGLRNKETQQAFSSAISHMYPIPVELAFSMLKSNSVHKAAILDTFRQQISTENYPDLLLLIDSDPIERQKGIWGLEKTSDPISVMLIGVQMTDSHPHVRYQALAAWSKFELNEAQIILVKPLLQDSDEAVRNLAGRVLEKKKKEAERKAKSNLQDSYIKSRHIRLPNG